LGDNNKGPHKVYIETTDKVCVDNYLDSGMDSIFVFRGTFELDTDDLLAVLAVGKAECGKDEERVKLLEDTGLCGLLSVFYGGQYWAGG
jgi:hypothetical protein